MDVVPRVNEKVLFDTLRSIIFVNPIQINLADPQAIVVPDLLEYFVVQPLKLFTTYNFTLGNVVLDFNEDLEILKDEKDVVLISQVAFEVVCDLDLSVEIARFIKESVGVINRHNQLAAPTIQSLQFLNGERPLDG